MRIQIYIICIFTYNLFRNTYIVTKQSHTHIAANMNNDRGNEMLISGKNIPKIITKRCISLALGDLKTHLSRLT